MQIGIVNSINTNEGKWAPSPIVAPISNFSGTPLSGVHPLSVVFTDSTTNIPNFWLWEKNDGTGWVNFSGHPTDNNPTELFAAGTYDIRLTVTNTAGSNTKTNLAYVVVS